MKHPEARFRPGGMRQALHGLAWLLLSGLAPGPPVRARQRTGDRTVDWRAPDSAPYLIALGAPGLRFLEPPPTPEPVLRPVAAGPPVPGLNAMEAAVAVANAAAVRIPTATDAKPDQVITPQNEAVTPVATKVAPPAILPDDTRPRVRAEDFLPFFQIPGTPAPLPPSSATYRLTPN